MLFVPRSIVFLALILLLGGYSYLSLRERIPALLEKREEIRREQELNLESKSQQDLEIRKKLKMLHEGETEFILPGTSKTQPQ
jgi:hypothetical protein